MSNNQFVRDTCMLIRHDAAVYHKDGWKKKAALTLGGLAAIGATGYANREKIKQGAGYVKRKTGDVIGAVGRHVEGNAKSQRGAMLGRRMRNVGYKMSPSQRNAV